MKSFSRIPHRNYCTFNAYCPDSQRHFGSSADRRLTEERFNSIVCTLTNILSTSKDDYLIIDLSGLAQVNEQTADQIFKLSHLLKLTGTELIITGIKPELAMKMNKLDANFSSLKTYSNVKDAVNVLPIM